MRAEGEDGRELMEFGPDIRGGVVEHTGELTEYLLDTGRTDEGL